MKDYNKFKSLQQMTWASDKNPKKEISKNLAQNPYNNNATLFQDNKKPMSKVSL